MSFRAFRDLTHSSASSRGTAPACSVSSFFASNCALPHMKQVHIHGSWAGLC